MLSIVIPAYNHAAYIEEAVTKARAIPVPGKRIIVIDDASSDNTHQVMTSYLERENADDVEYIRKPVNRGLVDSLNMFLDTCETEFVYMIASDDITVPEGIRTLMDMLVAQPDMGFIIGGGMNLLEDGRRTPIYTPKHDLIFSTPPRDLTRVFFLRDVSPLLLQSTVFRLKKLRDVGGFDADLVADDYAVFAKIFTKFPRRGKDFEFKPDVDCVRYRHHGSNSYRDLRRQALTNRDVIYRFAPAGLKNQSAGYRLALLILIGVWNGRPRSALSVLRLAKPREIPWIAVGLFVNAYQRIKNRQ